MTFSTLQGTISISEKLTTNIEARKIDPYDKGEKKSDRKQNIMSVLGIKDYITLSVSPTTMYGAMSQPPRENELT